MEKLDVLQSMGSQIVGHNLMSKQQQQTMNNSLIVGDPIMHYQANSLVNTTLKLITLYKFIFVCLQTFKKVSLAVITYIDKHSNMPMYAHACMCELVVWLIYVYQYLCIYVLFGKKGFLKCFFTELCDNMHIKDWRIHVNWQDICKQKVKEEFWMVCKRMFFSYVKCSPTTVFEINLLWGFLKTKARGNYEEMTCFHKLIKRSIADIFYYKFV